MFALRRKPALEKRQERREGEEEGEKEEKRLLWCFKDEEIVWKLHQLKNEDKREASVCPGEEDAREGNEDCFHIRAITQESC